MPACHAGDRRFESGRVRHLMRRAPHTLVGRGERNARRIPRRCPPPTTRTRPPCVAHPGPPIHTEPPRDPAGGWGTSRLLVVFFALLFVIGALAFLARVLTAVEEDTASPGPSASPVVSAAVAAVQSPTRTRWWWCWPRRPARRASRRQPASHPRSRAHRPPRASRPAPTRCRPRMPPGPTRATTHRLLARPTQRRRRHRRCPWTHAAYLTRPRPRRQRR